MHTIRQATIDEAVAKLCTARLAVAMEILNGRVPERSFREARNVWK